MMIHLSWAIAFCLIIAFAAFMLGVGIGEDSASPAPEGYYEIYLVSIVDTLGEQRNVSGIKFISEQDGYLTLHDTLGGWFIIPIRGNVDYIKCTVTDSVKCKGDR